jgi:hypothetical protein
MERAEDQRQAGPAPVSGGLAADGAGEFAGVLQGGQGGEDDLGVPGTERDAGRGTGRPE